MKKNLILFLTIIGITSARILDAQSLSRRLTLTETIYTAHEQSPSSLMAKHNFLASYWEYRSYKAQFLPSLNLNATLGQIQPVAHRPSEFRNRKHQLCEKRQHEEQPQPVGESERRPDRRYPIRLHPALPSGPVRSPTSYHLQFATDQHLLHPAAAGIQFAEMAEEDGPQAIRKSQTGLPRNDGEHHGDRHFAILQHDSRPAATRTGQ